MMLPDEAWERATCRVPDCLQCELFRVIVDEQIERDKRSERSSRVIEMCARVIEMCDRDVDLRVSDWQRDRLRDLFG